MTAQTTLKPHAASAEPAFATHCLARLARLIGLDAVAETDAERRLVRRSIFSTWLDCRSAGVGAEAGALLALRPAADLAPPGHHPERSIS